MAIAYRIKERLRDFYRTTRPRRGHARCSKSSEQPLPADGPCRPRSKSSDARISTWFDKIANFHLARVSNGPTEALNNLIKRIKRIGFGFRNFENYRIRALLYAGKPNWRVLGSPDWRTVMSSIRRCADVETLQRGRAADDLGHA